MVGVAEMHNVFCGLMLDASQPAAGGSSRPSLFSWIKLNKCADERDNARNGN